VSKRAIDTVFEALFTLTDIRVLLRETAPTHDLDAAQREEVSRMLQSLEKDISILREELIQ